MSELVGRPFLEANFVPSIIWLKILISDYLHYHDGKQNDNHKANFQQLSIIYVQECKHKYLNS